MKCQRAGTDKKIYQRIKFQQGRQEQLLARGLSYDAAVSQSCNEAKGLVLPLDRISVLDIIKHVENDLGMDCVGISEGVVTFQRQGSTNMRTWKPQTTEKQIKRLLNAGYQVAATKPGEWQARRRDFTIDIRWYGGAHVNRDGHANKRGAIYSSVKLGSAMAWVDKAET